MKFEFRLRYKLPNDQTDADQLMTRLCGAGCIDSLVGLGAVGQVSLEFIREASTAEKAILSAITDIKRALPSATLIEIAADVVG